MADSIITKKALASALKELMVKTPFNKISVGDICAQCGMNRKSFYYHFKDKYDLVNWIYDTEFIAFTKQKNYSSFWEFLVDLCYYLDQNRAFYKNALQIKGQNSFSEHFEELLHPVLKEYLESYSVRSSDFLVIFFSDACICAINRWMQEWDNLSAEDFLAQLKTIYEVLTKERDHI